MTKRPAEEGRAETGPANNLGSAGDVTPPVPLGGLPPGDPGSLGRLPGSRASRFGPGAGARTEQSLKALPGHSAAGSLGRAAGQVLVPDSPCPPLTDKMRINAQLDPSGGYPLPWDTEDDHDVRDVFGDGLRVSPPVVGED